MGECERPGVPRFTWTCGAPPRGGEDAWIGDPKSLAAEGLAGDRSALPVWINPERSGSGLKSAEFQTRIATGRCRSRLPRAAWLRAVNMFIFPTEVEGQAERRAPHFCFPNHDYKVRVKLWQGFSAARGRPWAGGGGGESETPRLTSDGARSSIMGHPGVLRYGQEQP